MHLAVLVLPPACFSARICRDNYAGARFLGSGLAAGLSRSVAGVGVVFFIFLLHESGFDAVTRCPDHRLPLLSFGFHVVTIP